jgi:hypothetical protein
MAETVQDRAAAVQNTAKAVQGLNDEAQTTAIQNVVPAPGVKTANALWSKLVVGLLILVAIALGGVI